MPALTADFDSPIQNFRGIQTYIAATGAVIFRGSLVQLDANGFATRAVSDSTLKIVGRAVTSLDGTEPAGSTIVCEEGDVFLHLAGTDTPTQANVGGKVFAASDNEVSTNAAQAPAGILLGLATGPHGEAGCTVRVTLEAAVADA